MRDLITLVEDKSKVELELAKLPYKHNNLDPVMSQETIDYHYGKLARGYVDRYNKHEGDSDFNEAGAYLHNLFFPQFQSPKTSNSPTGISKQFIEKHFGNFTDFKQSVIKEAMSLHGAGWVYLSRNGSIKTIKNHDIRKDIVLLIDMWEHAFVLDYLENKSKYLNTIWKIINWEHINQRL